MTLSFPYTTAAFLDIVYPKLSAIEFDDQRFDQFDGLGSGHDIQSEMADPKWRARLIFTTLTDSEERFLSSRVRKLLGSSRFFMLYDPRRQYPLNDPTGSIIGANTVQVNSISANRDRISFKGLTAAYKLAIGDRVQISYGTGRNFYGELSEDNTASGAGVSGLIEVYPFVPLGIAVNDEVVLKKPACKMMVKPDGRNMGQSAATMTEGVTLEVMEHV